MHALNTFMCSCAKLLPFIMSLCTGHSAADSSSDSLSVSDPCLVSWIRSCDLSMFDKELLISGQPLSANHTTAGQRLLKQAFPHQSGLQDTSLLSRAIWSDVPLEFVQVVHVEPNHWACLSNKFVVDDRKSHTVNIYDSLHTIPDVESSIVKQACVILNSFESTITINVIDVQTQQGTSDCGVFALAMAADLCRDLDPATVSYHQEKMRSHLKQCYEKSHLSPFPSNICAFRKKKEVVDTITVEIYCICRQPEKIPMVECDLCSEWYHTECVNVSDDSLEFMKDVPWFCPLCKSSLSIIICRLIIIVILRSIDSEVRN